ncbi:hypothetical protein ACROYT_G030304 [Oculina patagonica]
MDESSRNLRESSDIVLARLKILSEHALNSLVSRTRLGNDMQGFRERDKVHFNATGHKSSLVLQQENAKKRASF